jgi:hypothetical protein
MSPIHDQTYRRYEGTRLPMGRAWTIIARNGIRNMIGRRFFLIWMIIAWLPFIVRAVQIYLVANVPQASQLVPVNATMYRQFIEQQGIFVFFVTIYAGAGLIANDRRANALQIYLSKPLLRSEYIGGKFAVLAVFLSCVTLVPSILLLLLHVLLAGSFTFLKAHLFLIPSVILASLMRVIVASATILALSAISKSSRYVGVLYSGAIIFTNALYLVLRIILGSTRGAWVSITANIEQVTDVIFRQTPRYEIPWLVSLLVLAGLVVVSISVLERRVKGVEVVS